MCDTLYVAGDGATFFAKNSDRPVDEPQVVRWFAPRPAGAPELRTQYLDLGPDPGAVGFIGSQPTWLWGVEHGVNTHGVAIGNEKIWTTSDPRRRPDALLGMDLVRLGLERATTADHAREVITGLLQRHGQGGSGEHGHREPYDSSFLVADAEEAWIIETNDRDWAARRTTTGSAISNRISLTTDWDLISTETDPQVGADRRRAHDEGRFDVQRWRLASVPTGIADHRLRATTACARVATGPAEIVATLRDHGGRAWGNPFDDTPPTRIPDEPGVDGSGVTVCMHVRDYQTTTASLVAALPRDNAAARSLRVWVALGSPCVGIYVPTVAPHVAPVLSRPSTWHRFDALRIRAERSSTDGAAIRSVWAPAERTLWELADDAWQRGRAEAPWTDAELDDVLEAGFSALGV